MFLQGQKWINDVRICLEVFLLRNSTAYRHNGTCDELRKEGFSSHPRCYLQSGFCKVMLGSFQNLLCLGKVFDLSDFLSQVAIKQVSMLIIIVMVYIYYNDFNSILSLYKTLYI